MAGPGGNPADHPVQIAAASQDAVDQLGDEGPIKGAQVGRAQRPLQNKVGRLRRLDLTEDIPGYSPRIGFDGDPLCRSTDTGHRLQARDAGLDRRMG